MGQGAGGVGGLLAVSFKTNGAHFAAFDGNGNVAALVNAADGTTSANYEYDPFGQTIRLTGSVGELNPIRFSTQFADDVKGEIKYLYRPYGPSTGTWPNNDPIQELGFQLLITGNLSPLSALDTEEIADGFLSQLSGNLLLGYIDFTRDTVALKGDINLYGFVGNNPLGAIDLFGLTCSCCAASDKVPIWVCNRRLDKPGAWWLPRIGPFSHDFVACQDPKTFITGMTNFPAYGKQPNANGGGWFLWGKGYILPEPPENFQNKNELKHCTKRMVCPDEKAYLCPDKTLYPPSSPEPAKSFYLFPNPLPWGGNCHASAYGGGIWPWLK
jgi:RHS repeat-associated protein